MAINIRRALADEVEPALSLALDVFMEFNASLSTDAGISKFVDSCIRNDGYVNNYVSGRHLMFVALDGHKIVGMISERGNGRISMLYVDKNYHRQGIAAALMDTLIDCFRKAEIHTATLFAAPYAAPFYHAYGFADTDKEQNNDGFVVTPMALKITGGTC